MDGERWAEICDLFERVRVLDAAARDEALSAKPDLRAEVEELLGFHDRSGGGLDTVVSQPVDTSIGEYTIERVLGTGGMGTVYLAEGPHGPVALKRLHAHLAEQEGLRTRFEREAGLGRRVQHRNVVRTLGSEGADCIVMEYVEGQTLEDLLEEQGHLPEELCLHIATEVARGLEAIHAAGAVHRDLKPANVIITPTHEVKVMDLGIALPAEDMLRLSHTGQFVGTVRYCAPEQLRGRDEPVDGRADLYALGLLVYELATGRRAIQGEDLLDVMRAQLEVRPRPIGELKPQASPFLEELVRVLLAKRADERVADASTLVRILEDGTASDWWRERRAHLQNETRKPLRRIRVPRETPVFGRDDELAALQAAYEDARGGRGRVLLVEGEAGIGKTRLLDELLVRLGSEGEDVAVLAGTFPPGGAAYGVGAFRAAAREYLDAFDLDAVLPRFLADTPRLVPAFGAFLSGDSTPDGATPLDKGALQTVYLALLRGLAAERPVVLIVDDLHFASAEGRAFFSALALGLVEHRVLLVGTTRHGLPEPWLAEIERLDHSARLGLARLGPQELEQLLQDALGSKSLVQDLGWTIARVSDGNPYFVFEILRGLRDQGVLKRGRDGSWTTTETLPTIELPESLVDLMAARLSALGEEEQELLDIAACYGSPFDGHVLAEALDRPLIPLLRSLGRIEREHRLVRAYGSGFVFDHDQVREIVYQRMSASLRGAYHAALGETLQRRWTDPEPGQAAAICRHLVAGGQGARALPHVVVAARHLAETTGLEPGADLLEQALATPDITDPSERARLTYERAQMLRHMGRVDESHRAFEDAVRLGRAGSDTQQLILSLGRAAEQHMNFGEFETNRALLEEALALAREHDYPADEAQLIGQRGMSLWTQGHLDEAGADFEASFALAQETESVDAMMYAEAGLGLTKARRGQLAAALVHFAAWQKHAQDKGSGTNVLSALSARGKILRALGRRDEAAAISEEHATQARERGDRAALGIAFSALAELDQARGDLPEARQRIEAMLRIEREVGSREGMCSAEMQLAAVDAQMGDLEAARERLASARAVAEREGYAIMEQYAANIAADFAMFHGELEVAEQGYTAALEGIEALGAQEFRPSALNGLAAVHLARGDMDDARPLLEELLEVATAQGAPGQVMFAKTGLVQTGDLAAEAVRTELDELTPRLTENQLLGARWRLYQATGDAALLEAAHAQVQQLLARVPEDVRETMATRLVLMRDVLAAHTRSCE